MFGMVTALIVTVDEVAGRWWPRPSGRPPGGDRRAVALRRSPPRTSRPSPRRGPRGWPDPSRLRVASTSKPRPSSSISSTRSPSAPRRSDTRQVRASAWRPTLDSASRTSWMTSAARESKLGGHRRVDVGDRHDRRARLELRAQLADRLAELPVGEDARAQTEDVVAQIADRTVDVLDRVLEPCSDLGVVRERGRALQPHPHGEQRLDRRRRGAPWRSARAPRVSAADGAPAPPADSPGTAGRSRRRPPPASRARRAPPRRPRKTRRLPACR